MSYRIGNLQLQYLQGQSNSNQSSQHRGILTINPISQIQIKRRRNYLTTSPLKGFQKNLKFKKNLNHKNSSIIKQKMVFIIKANLQSKKYSSKILKIKYKKVKKLNLTLPKRKKLKVYNFTIEKQKQKGILLYIKRQKGINENLKNLYKKQLGLIKTSPKKDFKQDLEISSSNKKRRSSKNEQKCTSSQLFLICDKILNQVISQEINRAIGKKIQEQKIYKNLKKPKQYQSEEIKIEDQAQDSQNEIEKLNNNYNNKLQKQIDSNKQRKQKFNEHCYDDMYKKAVFIQKIWRGFYTRKLLREYFEQMYIENQHLNLQSLNRSQQYLYMQQQRNIIIEDEKEYMSDSNTHVSKVRKVPVYNEQPDQSQQLDRSKTLDEEDLNNDSKRKVRQSSLQDDIKQFKINTFPTIPHDILYGHPQSCHEKRDELLNELSSNILQESLQQSVITNRYIDPKSQIYQSLDLLQNQMKYFKDNDKNHNADQIVHFLNEMAHFIDVIKSGDTLSYSQMEKLIKQPQTNKNTLKISIEIPLIQNINQIKKQYNSDSQLTVLQSSVLNQNDKRFRVSSQLYDKIRQNEIFNIQKSKFDSTSEQQQYNLQTMAEVGSQEFQLNFSQISNIFGQNSFRQFAKEMFADQNKRAQMKVQIQNHQQIIEKEIQKTKNNFKQNGRNLEKWVCIQQKNLLADTFEKNRSAILTYTPIQVKRAYDLMTRLVGVDQQDLVQSYRMEEFYKSKVMETLSKSLVNNAYSVQPKKLKKLLTSIPMVLTSDDMFIENKSNNQKFEFPSDQREVQSHNSSEQNFVTINHDNIEDFFDIFIQAINESLIKNLNKPYDFDLTEKLQKYHLSKFEHIHGYLSIAPNELFNTKIKNKIAQLLQKFILNQNTNIIIECLINCFAEEINFFRPFECRGQPMPWQINSLKITYQTIDQDNINIVLQKAKEKVIEYNQYLCGLLEKDDFESQYVEEQRQKRLNALVFNEYIDQEEDYLTYDDQTNIVKLEISQLIQEELLNITIEETIQLLLN